MKTRSGKYSRKKVSVVFGTRPEAIKLAPVINELKRYGDRLSVTVVITGQHRNLVSPILTYFKIRPDHDLDLMKADQKPVDLVLRVCRKIDSVFRDERPDLVVVQGDTTSAMAAAQTAFYRKIAVAHVEAGLRTTDRYNPFPEEMNRRLLTQLCTVHFAATESNREKLLKENVAPESIFVTGNPVIDALHEITRRPAGRVDLPGDIKNIGRGRKLIVLTSHRRENFGEPQKNIFSAVLELLNTYPDVEIVYPVHPNPEVTRAVRKWLPAHPRLHRIEPMDYISFIRLLDRSYFVMTDSGGIQEEAPALGKPVLVLRVTTEREEILKSGNGILAGVEKDAILSEAARLIEHPDEYKKFSRRSYPFGKGNASKKIVRHIRNYLGV